MSAQWTPSRELYDATVAARKLWRTNHPSYRRPADFDHEAELHEFCRAFASLPLASIPIVAEQALDESRGHFPKPFEVRNCARAFLKRTAPERTAGDYDAPMPPDPIAQAQTAQALAMLRALDLDGPEVSRQSQILGITAATEALMSDMHSAVRAGRISSQCVEDFRNGAFPTIAELEAKVRRIAAAGRIDVSRMVERLATTLAAA